MCVILFNRLLKFLETDFYNLHVTCSGYQKWLAYGCRWAKINCLLSLWSPIGLIGIIVALIAVFLCAGISIYFFAKNVPKLIRPLVSRRSSIQQKLRCFST